MNASASLYRVRGATNSGRSRVELLERLLERREPEEPVLLALPVERDAVDRAGVALRDLRVGLEVRALGAVPALVQALVDVAVVVDALHDLLDLRRLWRGSEVRMKKSFDALIRGSRSRNRCALRSASSFGEIPSLLGDLRDRLAVLVGAREEEHVLAALAMVPGEDVGADRRVGVAQVRRRVHVVDGRRDVEGHGGGQRLAAPPVRRPPRGAAARSCGGVLEPVRSPAGRARRRRTADGGARTAASRR